jgi:hypothetical protein
MNRSVEPLSPHSMISDPAFMAATQARVASMSSEARLQITLQGLADKAAHISALWAYDFDGMMSISINFILR